MRRRAIVLALPPVALLGLLIWQVVLGHPWGKQPVSNGDIIGWTVFLWLIYLRLITVRLVTEVRPRELLVGLRGFWRSRRIPLESIQAIEIISHDIVRDYRGYGSRMTREGRAYVAGGNRAVRLKLAGGEKVVLGSERPDELAAAIRAAMQSNS